MKCTQLIQSSNLVYAIEMMNGRFATNTETF